MQIAQDTDAKKIAVKLFDAQPPYKKIKDGQHKLTIFKEHYDRAMFVEAKSKKSCITNQTEMSPLEAMNKAEELEQFIKRAFLIVTFTDKQNV